MFQFLREKIDCAYEPTLGVKIYLKRFVRDPEGVFAHIFECKSQGILFEFYVQYSSDLCTFKNNSGVECTQRTSVAAHIIAEGYANFNLRDVVKNTAFAGAEISEAEYERYKSILIEGVFCLTTHGGYNLKFVPKFYVDIRKFDIAKTI